MEKEKNGIMARIIRVFNPSYGRLIEQPEKVEHGANWESSQGVNHPFSQLGSMAVYATHGYTNAAASRVSQDLASIPIRLIQGKGPSAQIIENHPVIDLMDQPSTDIDQFEFMSQIILDFLMTGNAYILMLGPVQPLSIVRLHPEQVKILTSKEDGLLYYEFKDDQLTVRYPKERIIHIADSSWQTGPSAIYGTGKVQPLSLDIKTDQAASRLVCESASSGIPSILISPSDPADIWGPERRKRILSEYRKMAVDGGAMAISSQVQINPLQLNPRDMEFEKAKLSAQQVVSACFGCPPSVLGLPSATYATAKQENLSYWEVQKNRAKRFSSAWTKIARLWDTSLRIEYDFSGVPALQDLRTAQIDRVMKHVQLGMPVAEAYSYEGMFDAPIVPRGTDEPTETEEDQNRALLELIVSNYEPKPRYQDDEDEESEEEKPEKKTEKSSGLNG